MGLFAPHAAGFDLEAAGTLVRLALLIALFVVPMISLGGAVLALSNLRLGAIVMLAGAVCWLLVGVATGNHVTPAIGIAILLSVAGAIVAFVADSGVLPDGPDLSSLFSLPSRQKPARNRPRLMRERFVDESADDDEIEEEPAPVRRRPAPRPQPVMRAAVAPAPVAIEPVRARRVEPAPASRPRRDVQPEYFEDHSIEFRVDPTDPDGRQMGAARGYRQGYEAEYALLERAQGSWSTRVAGFLQAAFALIFVGGLGGLVTVDYLRGPESLLFGRTQSGAVATQSAQPMPPVPVIAPAPPSQPTAIQNVPSLDALITATSAGRALPTAVASLSSAPVVPEPLHTQPLQFDPNAPANALVPSQGAAVAPRQVGVPSPVPSDAFLSAPAPVAAVAAPAGPTPFPRPRIQRSAQRDEVASLASVQTASNSFADPFAYCAARGTDHRPDPSLIQADLPLAMVQNLRQMRGAMSAPARWRCADSKVYVCIETSGAVCSVTPNAQQMIAYCQANPGTRNIAAPGGMWSCEGARPVIPAGEVWPVDAYGYLPRAWVAAAPTR